MMHNNYIQNKIETKIWGLWGKNSMQMLNVIWKFKKKHKIE